MNAAPLTADDHFAIQQLYARYSLALDTGDGPGRAAVFTADGTFATYLSKHQPEPAAQLAERTTRTGNRGHRHLMANIVLTPTDEGARGIAYALILDSQHAMKTGFYEDTLVRTPEGWRFRTRELWLDSEPESPYRGRTFDAGHAPRTGEPAR